jgi:hypothetical protein
MKGDFSRVSFDPRNHFSQVLLQQGRVTLDADPNEQGAILLHLLRTMARDLFGPYGAPAEHPGFRLAITSGNTPTLTIGAGRYYVDGILCESEGCDYLDQPHRSPAENDPLRVWLDKGASNGMFWLYLDVWERHVTAIEHPSIREVALGGPDTCSRVQVVWQVKAIEGDDALKGLETLIETLAKRMQTADKQEQQRIELRIKRIREAMAAAEKDPAVACSLGLELLQREKLPHLVARIDDSRRIEDPCVMPPESGYRGVENHLYRVEIHRGSENGLRPTFKWSRENGSVLTAWLRADGQRLVVVSTRGFAAGQWVELSNDALDLENMSGPLLRVASIDGDALIVEGTPDPDLLYGGHPKIRRWDQADDGDTVIDEGAVPVEESSAGKALWIDLEDGVQIAFDAGADYRSGDYWLIPARVATGDIEWPRDEKGGSLPQPPRGVQHHYAPLGFLRREKGDAIKVIDCGCTVHPMNSCSLSDRVTFDNPARPVAYPASPATPGRDQVVVTEAARRPRPRKPVK